MSAARIFALIPLVGLGACAPSLLDDDGQATPSGSETPVSTAVSNLEVDGQERLTQVDASSNADWIYLDLDTAAEVYPEDPAAGGDWDLTFQRYVIAVNGGVSGGGSVEAAALAGGDFDALGEAPAEGYRADQPSAEVDGEVDYALGGWWDYDSATHVLSPADVVYVVMSTDGQAFKLQMMGYYDEAGTAGFPTFRWAPLPP